MKKILLLMLLENIFSLTMFAQDITGQWNGALKVSGGQLRLVFHVNKTGNGLSSTMDSPDQGAKGIPTTTTSFENDVLKITVAAARIEYVGSLGADKIITGTFKQGGRSFPMNLSREKIEKEKLVRPQEPTKPFPYHSEDVTFENRNAKITLSGTLTLPQKEGIFPTVILISGSGPQNRDQEILGHKPFLVISDYLTRNGIAVLRYDDRGTANSTGNFNKATSADFATDVEAAVDFLKTRQEINQKKIGLIGHSEGGLIAPIIASRSKDISFIVLLAGPGQPIDELLLTQQQLIGQAMGGNVEDLQKSALTNRKIFDLVKRSTSSEQLRSEMTSHLKQTLRDQPNTKPEEMSEADFIDMQLKQIANPWMEYFIKYDPTPVLEKVKCPVLALNGAKDLQVAPKENLTAIQKALIKGKNKKVTIKQLPNLNHLFQEATTGSPQEYEAIQQTFSPAALNEILHWLQVQIK